jgi:hypothetical protein
VISRRTKWLLAIAAGLVPLSFVFVYFTIGRQNAELARLAETSWSIPMSQFSQPTGTTLVELLFVLGLAALLGGVISAIVDFLSRKRGRIV